jgi:hypothetical protein
MECQDRARDSVPSGAEPTASQIGLIEKNMKACFSGCVETHVKLLPTLEKRITDAVKQVKGG